MNHELGIRNHGLRLKRFFNFLIHKSLFIIPALLASPAFAQVSSEVQGLALTGEDPRIIAARIIRVVLSFLGIVVLGLILYGGYLWMTAVGNEEQIDKAKKVLTNSVVGLVIILSAFSITQFILNKLIEATEGPGAVSISTGPGGGAGLPPDAFVVRSIDPKGAVSIRNVVAQVVFSRAPTSDQTKLDNNVSVTRADTGAKVGVTYSVTGTTIEITPKASCPSPHERRKCFDADADFKVEVKPALVSAAGRVLLCGSLAPTCTGQFKTGNLIDVEPPTVEVTYPDPGQAVSVDECVHAQAKVTDDAGVRRVEFYADNALIEGGTVVPATTALVNDKVIAIVEIPCWPADPPAPKAHKLKAKAFDLDTNSVTSAEIEVMVRPKHCFSTTKDDDEDGVDCDSAVGGLSGCGLCNGATCTANMQCEGGVCADTDGDGDKECARPTTITGVSPGDGKAGTFVTVAGWGFGTVAGKVVFKDNQIAGAPAACAGKSTWSDNYALVGVPDGAITGPITIIKDGCAPGDSFCRDATDDTRGPLAPVPNGSFEVNTVGHPGLCSVSSPPNNLPQGLLNTRVDLRGAQFGTELGAVWFGATSSTGIANWSDAGATTAVPAIDYGSVMAQVLNSGGVPSNALPYHVLSPDDGTLPKITSITPSSGGVGTGITIVGSNFGAAIGSVYFIAPDGTSKLADVSVPTQCGSTWWSPTLIVVKVPQGLAGPVTLYVHRYDNQQSTPPVPFEVTSTLPGPFLACIRPMGGPAFSNVSVYGDNLGDSVMSPRGLYFTSQGSGSTSVYNNDGAFNPAWAGARATLTATGGAPSDPCPALGWATKKICAQVPNDPATGNVARTGQVRAEQDRDGTTHYSNPLSFAVGSCRAPAGDPLHLDCGSLICCGDGSCNSVCPTIVTPISAYGWQFSTSPAPVVPEVVDQCDKEVGDEGHPLYPPSPSPAATPAGRQSNAEVCVNAQVAVTLSTPVVPTTLSASNIKIEKCTGADNLISGANSSFGGATSVWDRPPVPAIPGAPAHASQLEVTYEQGQGRAFDLNDDSGNWALRLKKLDDDTGPGWVNEAGLQQNYEHWFGYQASVISDTNGKTYTATAWMKAGDTAAVGKRAGILIQRDGSLLPADVQKAWQKASQEIALTQDWQSVSVTITFDSGPAASAPGYMRVFLEGTPYDIRVPEPPPDPRQLFSALFDDVQVTGDPCTQVTANQFNAGNFELAAQDRGFRWWPLVNFDKDAWYRVTLLGGTGGIKAAGNQGQEMEVMENPQVVCGYANAAYCFRFKTKNDPVPKKNLCAVGGIAVTPSPFTAKAENEMIDYSAVPVALGDPCVSPRPDRYTWEWVSADVKKATVSYNNTVTPPHIGYQCASDDDCAIGTLPACVGGYCAQMGWTTTTTTIEETDDLAGGYVGIQANTEDVTGTGKLTIEFESPRIIAYFPNCGEACQNAEIGAQFNKAMRAVATAADAVTNPANLQVWAVPCGNGTVDAGEDCDDGNIENDDGCSAVCLNEGSDYLLRCGDGNKDTFEDCDDGNFVSGDGCSDRCIHEGASTTCGNGAVDIKEDCDDRNTQDGDGCSSKCLHEGTRFDIAICGNKRLDRGEECEAGFDGTFESWCSGQTCLRQGPAETARCGNGRIDPGEECDPNSALLDSSAKKTLCNATCQWTGTLRPASSGGQGCGNGRIELGEDCDDGNLRPNDGCDGACRNEGSASGNISACGNGGVPDPGEDCDDGNITDGDGCSAKCLNEGRPGAQCGNRAIDFGEDCDRALLQGGTGVAICSADCRHLGTDAVQPAIGEDSIKPNTCGNGEIDDGEDCDGGAYCAINCTHVAGRPAEPVSSSNFTFGWDSIRNELTVTPTKLLSANTFYRVLLRGDDPATTGVEGVRASRGVDLVSGKALTDDPETTERELNYVFNWSGSAAPTPAGHTCKAGVCNTFSWTFRTKGEVCGVNAVELSPPEASLYVIGGRQSYSAASIGAPDSCNPQGQRLNPLSFNWGWDTLAHNVAIVVDAQSPAATPYGINVIPSCGNGRVDYGEDCDDGNTVSNDGCFGTDVGYPCTNEGSGFAFACGNGRLDPGEECENPDGLLCSDRCLRLGNTGCTSGSTQNCCGNGTAEDGRSGRANFGEDCDDGNFIAGDGCSPRCLHEGGNPLTGACGNGVIDASAGEECDTLAAICNPDTCLLRGTLAFTRCKNGHIEPGEECEDGNTRSGDGCSARCLYEGTRPTPAGPCGNGRLDLREDCDDGNTQNGDGCSNGCLNEGTVLEQGSVAPATLPEAPPRIDPYQQAEARGIAKFCRPLTGNFPTPLNPCVTISDCSGTGVVCAPPNPWTTTEITAFTQRKTGNAALTVFCVAASDKDCPIPSGVPGGGIPSDTIGRGADNCCYARPQVLARTPPPGAVNVCRNGLLRATFNQALDPQSLPGNFIIARRATGNGCAVGEQTLSAQGNLVSSAATSLREAPGFFERLWERMVGFVKRVIPDAQAEPTVWCVAQDVAVIPAMSALTANGSEVTLQPSKLLGSSNEEIVYRIAIVGDKDITDSAVSGLRSAQGVGFYGGTTGVDQSWEFTAGRDICTLDQVEASGGTNFSFSGETANAQATAYTNARTPRQPIYSTAGYSWIWSWGTADDKVATVTNSIGTRCGGTLYGAPCGATNPPCAGGQTCGTLIVPAQTVTAGTKNGITQINATAIITEDTVRNANYMGQCRTVAGSSPSVKKCFNHPDQICTADADCGELVGTTVAGTAEFSTFFCENPWPEDPSTLYRLMDTAEHTLGGTRTTNFSTRYCRDGDTVLPELKYQSSAQPPVTVLAPPFNAVSQMPQILKEVLLTTKTFSSGVDVVGVVQTPASQTVGFPETNPSFSYTFNFPDDGDYELTTETSNYDANSEPKDDDLSNLSAVLEARNIPDEVRNVLRAGDDADKLTGAYYHTLRVKIDGVEVGSIRAKAVSASAPHSQGKVILQAVAKGPHIISIDWINDERLPSTSMNVEGADYDAGEIWDANLQIHKLTLKKGRAKDDAIGIRIMSNPGRLSVRDWYEQMNFGGQPTPLASPIDGYEAIQEGNTIYIGATNATPPALDPASTNRVVFGNVYLVSLSEGAHPEVKAISDQLVKNLAFNVNVENLRTCEPECSGDMCTQKPCSKDLDCAIGEKVLCRADKDKLSRDLIRMNHVEAITAVLAGYKTRTGRYPTLEAGTFIRAMSTSRWPSWGATFGSALGAPLPQDPINRFGALCVADANEQGTYDSATCWNELAQKYRCPVGSHIYQYESRGGQGYALKTEFELLERPDASPPTWDVEGWPSSSSGEVTVLTGGVCDNMEWSNTSALCGNQVIETGEACERGTVEERIVPLTGETRCSGDPAVTCSTADPCSADEGICRALTSCVAQHSCASDCRGWENWRGGLAGDLIPTTAASCRPGGTFCGNGIRDGVETCDDGLLNGQYGKCKTDCEGPGIYCGDGTRNGPETCDEGALNGSYGGHCRFDCSGIGERCGDGEVQVYQTIPVTREQCDGGTRATARICTGTGADAGRPCVQDSECASGACRFCEVDSTGVSQFSSSQQRNSSGYPYLWSMACNPASCQWPDFRGPAGIICSAQGECGNKSQEGDEECDDGNSDNADGCIIANLHGPFDAGNNCVRAKCNDGFNKGLVCTAGPAERRGNSCTGNAQCGAGGVCQDPEECDLGNALNGQPCDAPYGGNCTACDRNCNIVTQSGGVCGDTVWQSPQEQCEGANGFTNTVAGVLMPTWVCLGTIGGSEQFWNFAEGLEDWTISDMTHIGSGSTLVPVLPGYNSNSAMKIVVQGGSEEAVHRFSDTDGKRYTASAWINRVQTSTPAPSAKIIFDRWGIETGDVLQQSPALVLDTDAATWQYIEFTANYDTGPNRGIDGTLRVQVKGRDNDEVLVDQIHLRPALTPTCTTTACTRECRGGSVCQNILKRCELGVTPGAECAQDADCNSSDTSDGTCVDYNFDRPGLRCAGEGSARMCLAQNPYDIYDPANPPHSQRIGDLISDVCDNDKDNDGYPDGTGAGFDCADNDARANPDGVERCGDGIDADCDGQLDECVAVDITISDAGAPDDQFKLFMDGAPVTSGGSDVFPRYDSNGDTIDGSEDIAITQIMPGTHRLKLLFWDTVRPNNGVAHDHIGSFTRTFSDNISVTSAQPTLGTLQANLDCTAIWGFARCNAQDDPQPPAAGYGRLIGEESQYPDEGGSIEYEIEVVP